MAPKRPVEGSVESRRFKSTYKDFVTAKVVCGEKEESFIVYRDVICERSKLFKTACSERWSKEGEKPVLLLEHQPEIFKAYVDWMYGGESVKSLVNEIAQTCADRAKAEATDHSERTIKPESHVLDTCVDLWSLGDYINDLSFMNEILSTLHVTISPTTFTVATIPTIKRIFDVTRQDCCLQRYVIDWTAVIMDKNALTICYE